MGKPDKFRVWWIPQIPMEPFYVDNIATYEEAERIADVLADYDTFQYENKIKPDFSNTGGVLFWDEDEQEWLDYEPEDWEN